MAITREPNVQRRLADVVRMAGAAGEATDVGAGEGGEPLPMWTVHEASVDMDGMRLYSEE